jgi:hypothetical protein
MKTPARKQVVVWGGLMILVGILLLVEAATDLTSWAWVAILGVAGLGAFALYLTDPSDWRLLIPAYVMWSVAALVALVTMGILRDEFVATFVLAVIALPFLVAFLRHQSRWGLLIPVYILLVVGMMVALIGLGVLNDLLIAAYVLFAISIPFFVVYLRNHKRWWSLIPSGITAIVGLSFLIAEDVAQYIGAAALVVVGGWMLMRQLLRKGPTDLESDGPPPE